ncbi:hypothetical protein Bbelb_119660 [Branchiostoma belcheri]|nr:hypothetical protein Bbelb_119660 [Branchiostoma belcheri]
MARLTTPRTADTSSSSSLSMPPGDFVRMPTEVREVHFPVGNAYVVASGEGAGFIITVFEGEGDERWVGLHVYRTPQPSSTLNALLAVWGRQYSQKANGLRSEDHNKSVNSVLIGSVQDIVSEAAGYLPGAFRTPTNKGDKMPLKETFNCDHNNRCPPGSRARTKLAGATSPTGTGAIGTDAFLVDRGRFHFILVLLDFRWRFKATVTTRRTCFCVLSTCKNVGKRRGSVRVEYRLRTESYGFGSSSTQTRRRTLRPSKTFSACRLRIHHPCVRVRATPVPRTYRTKEARVRHGLLTVSVCNRTEIVRCKHVQLTYHLRNVRCTQLLTARPGVQTTLLHFAQPCE